VYIEDKHELGIDTHFAEKHPYSMQDLTAIMLETIRKGLWSPSQEVIDNLADIHTALVIESGAGCSYETCANDKLHEFIGSLVPAGSVGNYLSALNAVLQSSVSLPEVEGIQLEKTEIALATPDGQPLPMSGLVALVFLCGALILLVGFLTGGSRSRSAMTEQFKRMEAGNATTWSDRIVRHITLH